MALQNKYPAYIKVTFILISLCLVVFIMKELQNILMPFAIAALFAVLLNPLNKRFERKMPRILSVLLTVMIGVVFVGGLVFFLSHQISLFSSSVPLLQQRATELFAQFQQRLLVHLNITMEQQASLFSQAANNNTQIVTQTLGGIYGTLIFLLLIPFYVFLLLYYKPLILEFLFDVAPDKKSTEISEILNESEGAVQNYIVGVLIETAIVAVMNVTALLIIGVKYALLLGVVGGLINMLPYVGGIVSVLLPMIMVFITKGTLPPEIAIMIAYAIIQFIDNNILVPRIVSSKVQINALISVVFLLGGAALWGVPGMFLSLPFIGVLKIIFDRVEVLKPWGKLLGVEVPTAKKGIRLHPKLRRLVGRKD